MLKNRRLPFRSLFCILPVMKKSAVLFFIALLFVILVLSDLLLWFAVSSHNDYFTDARDEYLSYYPTILQNARLLTAISILMLTFSGFIFINARRSNSYKVHATFLGLLCTLLLMYKIFTFM